MFSYPSPGFTLFRRSHLMALEQRQEAIRRLEEIRGSRIVTYVTGDRPSGGPGLTLPLQVEPTVVPVIQEALRRMGRQPRLDLFLYTRGGAVDVVWPVISFLRKYAEEKLSVIVPFRAHSAGTLLALGADNIVMSEAAELTSIDPTAGNVFSPPDELNQGQRKGVSVEDLAAYFDFATEKKQLGLGDAPYLIEVFKELTKQLHPLAIGHVQRVHRQIRFLAGKLLSSRREPPSKKIVAQIVETLTEKLYSHSHAVTCTDAKELLGNVVSVPDQDEEKAIWDLFSQYSDDLKLSSPHNLLADLGGDQQKILTYMRGSVETTEYSHVYLTEVRLTVFSKTPKEALYSQAAQDALTQLPASKAGLPCYVSGLASEFTSDVIFEGWRSNNEGV